MSTRNHELLLAQCLALTEVIKMSFDTIDSFPEKNQIILLNVLHEKLSLLASLKGVGDE